MAPPVAGLRDVVAGADMTAPLTAVEQRIARAMRATLRAKQRRQRERKAPPAKAESDRRKYGKRGWTWTP